MKRLWILLTIIALARCAHATPVKTVQFVEIAVITTDTVENAGGNVLFTTSAVVFSDSISPIIAGDLSADSTVPSTISNVVPLIPRVSEYQFLITQDSDYVVLNGTGPAFAGASDDASTDGLLALELAAGPAYGYVSGTTTGLGTVSYSTGGVAPDDTIWQGTVVFDLYATNAVEQPVSAPEPSALALLACGLLPLAAFLAARKTGMSRILDRKTISEAQ